MTPSQEIRWTGSKAPQPHTAATAMNM